MRKIYNGTNEERNLNSVRIIPVKAYPTVNTSDLNPVRDLKFTCVSKDEPTVPVKGCKLNLDLRLKEGPENTGGHNHVEPGRPLGHFSSNNLNYVGDVTGKNIPESGLSINYESPPVAGVVSMSVSGEDTDGNYIVDEIGDTNFTVRINEELESIKFGIEGFAFDDQGTSSDPGSHPGEGFYLTQVNREKLSSIVSLYREIATDKDVDNIPAKNIIELVSQAASLKWGGVYDIYHAKDYIRKDGTNYGRQPWKKPHSLHRLGNSLDISMNPFNSNKTIGPKSKRSLYLAILINTLGIPMEKEDRDKDSSQDPVSFPGDCARPTDETCKHWHFEFR